MKTLAELKPSSTARIVRVEAGYGLKARLTGMGFVPGAKVKILENIGGHIVVVVGEPIGRTVALSRGIASKVIVEEEKDSKIHN